MDDTLFCESTPITNLTFCSMMNGRLTDKAFFSKPIVTGNGTYITYAEYMDKFLEDTFNKLYNFLGGNTTQPCPACFQKLKFAYCANAFPTNGFVSCVSNNFLDYLNEIGKSCKDFCCTDSGLCVIDNNGQSCHTKAISAENTGLLACIVPKLDQLFSKLSACNHHFLNLHHCQDLLSTCDCSQSLSDYKYTCERFYTNQGINFGTITSGTCSASKEKSWCKSGARSIINEAMSEVRGKVMEFIAPVVQSTEQFIDPGKPLKADIARDIQIGTPVPFYYPNLKTVSFAPPATSEVETWRKRMACQGEECEKGCTNPKAYVYNPFAGTDSGKCNVDPFYLLTLLSENRIIIAVVISIVLFVICVGFAFFLGICIYCCCCRERAKMRRQGKRELLEKKDLKTNRLQKAADKILNKL